MYKTHSKLTHCEKEKRSILSTHFYIPARMYVANPMSFSLVREEQLLQKLDSDMQMHMGLMKSRMCPAEFCSDLIFESI